MSVRFNNGKQATRSYEEIGQNLSFLQETKKRYDFHLKALCDDTYKKFQALKEDFEGGLIGDGIYRDFLKPLKYYFENNPQPYFSELHYEEIKIEIQKHLKYGNG